MTLLRDEALAGVNDLIAASRAASEAYHLAAEKLHGMPLARKFHALAVEREDAANRLSEFVIAQNDVPSSHSGEKVLVESVVTSLKSAVGFDETALVVEHCETKEKYLHEMTNSVLHHLVAQDIREEVTSLQSATHGALTYLKNSALGT